MNDKNDIKVSVIIPAYNAADFIVDALQSILTQTVQPIEVVVVNDGSRDGSRDGTGELARQWGAERQLDFKLIVVDQENKGLPASRNVGIGQSSGNWIALLDADDIWESTHLEELISALKSVPDAVASYGAGHLLVDGVLAETLYDDFWDNPSKKIGKSVEGTNHYRLGQEVLPRLIKGNFIKPSSLMVSASAIAQSGLFDVSLRTSEDREFLIRLILKGDLAHSGAHHAIPLACRQYFPIEECSAQCRECAARLECDHRKTGIAGARGRRSGMPPTAAQFCGGVFVHLQQGRLERLPAGPEFHIL